MLLPCAPHSPFCPSCHVLLAGIAAACHDFGVPLLVDEAHGGHFGFLHQPDHREGQAAAPSAAGPSATAAAPPALPNPALRCGADLVMQSTHKVLGAMTQVGRVLYNPALLWHGDRWPHCSTPRLPRVTSLCARACTYLLQFAAGQTSNCCIIVDQHVESWSTSGLKAVKFYTLMGRSRL